MTLRDLLAALHDLPVSALDAVVSLETGDVDAWDVGSVRYERGAVVILCDADDDED